MIHRIEVTDPEACCVPWWSTSLSPDLLVFKPGLNLLWGPNGSGKSTILRLMARTLHCEQGGVQVVTQTSWQKVLRRAPPGSGLPPTLLSGVLPVHDGMPTAYFDAGAKVGLLSGTFDYDFTEEGLKNATYKGSSGQTIGMSGHSTVGKLLTFEGPPKLVLKQRYHLLEDALTEWLRGSEPPSHETYLLDEPDRSIDVPLQRLFWLRVAEASRKHLQVIAATHSPLAINLPGAHHIELVPGYLQSMREAVRSALE